MGPADQNRQIDPIAPALNSRREKPEEPPRLLRRPDQDRANIGPEDRRRRKRKGRFVKHIWLERARGKLAPLRRDRLEPGQRAPFHREGIGRVAVRERSAAGSSNGRRCVSQSDNRRRIVRDSDGHARPSAFSGRTENQTVEAETVFRQGEQTGRFEYQRHGAGNGGAEKPERRDQRHQQDEVQRK